MVIYIYTFIVTIQNYLVISVVFSFHKYSLKCKHLFYKIIKGLSHSLYVVLFILCETYLCVFTLMKRLSFYCFHYFFQKCFLRITGLFNNKSLGICYIIMCLLLHIVTQPVKNLTTQTRLFKNDIYAASQNK